MALDESAILLLETSRLLGRPGKSGIGSSGEDHHTMPYVLLTAAAHGNLPFDQLRTECENLLRGLGYRLVYDQTATEGREGIEGTAATEGREVSSKPPFGRSPSEPPYGRWVGSDPRVVEFWSPDGDPHFVVTVDRHEYGAWVLTSDRPTHLPWHFFDNFLRRVSTQVTFWSGPDLCNHYVPPDYTEEQIRESIRSRVGDEYALLHSQDSTGICTVYPPDLGVSFRAWPPGRE